MYVEYSLQNRFVFSISLFGLSAILKIRKGEHAHFVGLVVAYTWNREKQMFVALGKEFDMTPFYSLKDFIIIQSEIKLTWHCGKVYLFSFFLFKCLYMRL